MKREKTLEIILTLAIALVIFYLIFKVLILLVLSILIGLIGLTSKYLSGKIAYLWIGFSKILGLISSKILLTAVFYLFLFPISMFYRLFNKNKLFKQNKGKASIYMERNHKYLASDMENMW